MEMKELEKVIKGLEQFKSDLKPFCGNNADWKKVDDALALLKESVPQGVVDQIRWERDTALSQLEEIGKGLGEKMDDIVALLKEQKAVEPEVEVLNEIDRIYRCPKCHKHFFYEKQKHCDQCGQSVKWK